MREEEGGLRRGERWVSEDEILPVLRRERRRVAAGKR